MAEGRGQLSAIDRLPDWADETKLWAFSELKERKRTQLDILDEFNARLRAAALTNGVMDPPQISRTAFNRTACRLAVLGRRLEETREIAAVLAPKLEAAGDDSVTLLVSESIKMLLNELLSNAGEIAADGATAEMLMMTARALKHAEEAKRISTETRRKIETEFQTKAAKAVDAVAASKGLSAETVESIKAKILGVTRPAGTGGDP
ncbi:hypothetical protein CCR97_28115 [Rhodoplanes elegans]|uniref:Uncharacterized protein n=1 Tax=Rhodoplanes elegans TaxID=29408 RepID=A0A327JYV7_9BRAD|nr:DUF3486 family protein [Rhodoplanes elegans]MBK5962032.1 hypothetical protein [Rhodoplanes elegans]RAI28278.1 hypothetical protein CH338_29495 [Rhodoplanes elegans]